MGLNCLCMISSLQRGLYTRHLGLRSLKQMLRVRGNTSTS